MNEKGNVYWYNWFIYPPLVLCLTFVACNQPKKPGDRWEAPEDADKLKSPLQNKSLAEQKGKELYNVYCWSCHGETGFGDGAAGGSLDISPLIFTRKG